MKHIIFAQATKLFHDPVKFRKVILITISIIIVFTGAVIYFHDSSKKQSSDDILTIKSAEDVIGETTSASNSETNEDIDIENSNDSIEIYIDVAGAVNNPGVINLKAQSRVFEAIEAAGGLKSDANIQTINRASVLNDGDRIYVPTEDEVERGYIPDNSLNSPSSNASSGTASSGTNTTGDKVNINTADSEGLQKLNGVGPSTAQKIIDYRNSNGKFKKLEDLKKVSGIGEKTFTKLKDNITI